MRSLSSYLYKQIHPPLLNLFPSRVRRRDEFAKPLVCRTATGFVAATPRSECLAQPASDTDRQPAVVWHWSALVSCPSFSHSFAQQRCLPFVPPPPPLHSASSPLHAFHYGSLRSANTTREHNLRVEIMPPPRRRTEKRGKGGGEPASDGLQVGRRPLPPCGWS